jgi:predicted ATPase
VDGGYRLGKAAVQLSDKFGVSNLRTQCTMIVNTFIIPWKEPLANILEPLRRNYWYGLETGNIEFAAYSAQVYCYSAFYCGHNLQTVTGEMERFLGRIGRLRQDSSTTCSPSTPRPPSTSAKGWKTPPCSPAGCTTSRK